MKTSYALEQEEFDMLIEKVVEKVVEEVNKLKAVEKPRTREEMAAYMNISPTTFDRRIKTGVLPQYLRHFNGGTLYYFASEFEAFLKKTK